MMAKTRLGLGAAIACLAFASTGCELLVGNDPGRADDPGASDTTPPTR